MEIQEETIKTTSKCQPTRPTVLALMCSAGVVLALFCFHEEIGNVDIFLVLKTSISWQEKEKVILTWNRLFKKSLADYLESINVNCSHKCTFTGKRSMLESSDAVIFHIPTLNYKDLPRMRNPQQFFVFFNLESPLRFDKTMGSVGTNYFNMTMTFRRDGDVLGGYGKLELKNETTASGADWLYEEVLRSFDSRNKSVLQIVSNCKTPSQRELYTAELRKHINVTVLGKCGGRKCDQDCEQQAVSEHRFYLSFENSICRDYVTEKLFRRVGQLIPVVLKRSIYDGIMPSEGFIAVDDFETPKQLAEYLRYLEENRTAFNSYLEWTKYYRRWTSTASCDLCRFLHEKEGTVNIVLDVKKWWFSDGKCERSYITNFLPKPQQ